MTNWSWILPNGAALRLEVDAVAGTVTVEGGEKYDIAEFASAAPIAVRAGEFTTALEIQQLPLGSVYRWVARLDGAALPRVDNPTPRPVLLALLVALLAVGSAASAARTVLIGGGLDFACWPAIAAMAYGMLTPLLVLRRPTPALGPTTAIALLDVAFWLWRWTAGFSSTEGLALRALALFLAANRWLWTLRDPCPRAAASPAPSAYQGTDDPYDPPAQP